MKLKHIIILFFSVTCIQAIGQEQMNDAFFKQEEAKIWQLFDSLTISRDSYERDELADKIKDRVEEMLKKPGSFWFAFDSLKTISVVKSKKDEIRILTWVVPNLYGTYKHYGFVQTNEEAPRYYELMDKSDSLTRVDQRMLGPDNWFGAVYYELIDKRVNGKRVYTLLGLHPNNASTTKKVVDVMFFDDMGKLKFGAPIFQLPKKLQKRIVFEYSAQATMSLKYHKVKSFLFFKRNLIVFDHLSPPDLSLLNQFQYYGPDFSNDALKFKKGRWVYMEDVDARNEN